MDGARCTPEDPPVTATDGYTNAGSNDDVVLGGYVTSGNSYSVHAVPADLYNTPDNLFNSDYAGYWQDASTTHPYIAGPAVVNDTAFDRTGEGFLGFVGSKHQKNPKPSNFNYGSSIYTHEAAVALYNPKSYSGLDNVFGESPTAAALGQVTSETASMLTATGGLGPLPEQDSTGPERTAIEQDLEQDPAFSRDSAIHEREHTTIAEERTILDALTAADAEAGSDPDGGLPKQDFGINPQILCPLGCGNLLGLRLRELRDHVETGEHAKLFPLVQDTVDCPVPNCNIPLLEPIARKDYHLHLHQHLIKIAGATVTCKECNVPMLRKSFDRHVQKCKKHRGIPNAPRKSRTKWVDYVVGPKGLQPVSSTKARKPQNTT